MTEADTVDNVRKWIHEAAEKWGQPYNVVFARVELAMKQKRELFDLCGNKPTTLTWHFEDYFRDLLPEKESKGVAFDALDSASDVANRELRDNKAVRNVLKQVAKKLNLR